MDLVTIDRFESPAEARMTMNVLVTAGIRATVVDETVCTMLWHMGTALGGIKLQVFERDAPGAVRVLGELAEHNAGIGPDQPTSDWSCPGCGKTIERDLLVCWNCGTTHNGVTDASFVSERDGSSDDSDDLDPIPRLANFDAQSSGPVVPAAAPAPADWQCPKCGEEVDGDFDVCWNCGLVRIDPGIAAQSALAESETDDALSRHVPAGSAEYVEPDAGQAMPLPSTAGDVRSELSTEQVEEIITRAWRASIISIYTSALSFILNFYSTYLLIESLKGRDSLTASQRRRVAVAIAINVPMLVVFVALLGVAMRALLHPETWRGITESLMEVFTGSKGY